MTEKEKFILFYSDKCGECSKFIKLLKEYPDLDKVFDKISIGSLSPNQLPPQLTHVPGVISGNQLLMGPNAFTWLGEKVKSYFSSGPNLNPKGGFDSNNFSFIGNDESGYSSNFSSWGEDTSQKIDPDKFDSRSGKPKDTPPVPQQLKSQQITSGNDKTSDMDLNRMQQEREMMDKQIGMVARS